MRGRAATAAAARISCESASEDDDDDDEGDEVCALILARPRPQKAPPSLPPTEFWRCAEDEDDDSYPLAALYAVRRAVALTWSEHPHRFKDYVANPKPSGYQSLHTTCFVDNMVNLEVQIRTQRMHNVATYGPSSHKLYSVARRDPNLLTVMQLLPGGARPDGDMLLPGARRPPPTDCTDTNADPALGWGRG